MQFDTECQYLGDAYCHNLDIGRGNCTGREGQSYRALRTRNGPMNKITAFYDMVPCNPIDRYKRFGEKS
jgi:hypothetical protein